MKAHLATGVLTLTALALTVYGFFAGDAIGGLGLALVMSAILIHVSIWGAHATGMHHAPHGCVGPDGVSAMDHHLKRTG